MQLESKHRPHINTMIKRLDSSFYFYDLDHLKARLTKISEVLDPDIKLWYACKANPISAILKIFRNLNFGIDVASQGELDQVLRSGVEPQNILSTGPSKSRKYLKSLIHNEVNVVVLESINQAYWLDEIAKETGQTPKVLLRVQLPWEEGKSVLGGDEITPFGLDKDSWRELDFEKCKNLDFQGFHVFQWGNILEIDKLKKIWWKIAEQISDFSKEMNIPLKVVDLGGGLGIPYDNSPSDIDFKDVNDILVEIKNHFKIDKVWMELGRYAVGTCGFYLSQVIDKKHVRGKEILVLDGGINHIARPALTDQSFPAQLLRESNETKRTYNVHGPLCTALDKLGEFELPEDIDEQDWLVFSNCGAYGFTESMPFFLCHNLPAEVLVYNGDLVTPRTIKSASDWLV